MNLTNRGQGTIEAFVGVLIIVIMLMVSFTILGPIQQVLDSVLISLNSAVISNVSSIRIIVGLIGLIIAAMAIVQIVQMFQRPRFQQRAF